MFTWSSKKTARQRRLETRRGPSVNGGSAWRRFLAAGGAGSLLLVVVFYIGVLVMDAWPPDPLPYRLGQYIPNDIYARVSFEVPSQRLLSEALDNARNTTAVTFRLNQPLVDEIITSLKALPGKLASTSQPAQVDVEAQKQFGLSGTESLQVWRSYTQPVRRDAYAQQLQRLREALSETPIVRSEELERSTSQFWMARGDGRGQKHASSLISLGKTDAVNYEVSRMARLVDPAIAENVKSYLLDVFAKNRPLYVYDAEGTGQDIKDRLNAIAADPPKEAYQAGQRLIRPSRREGSSGEAISHRLDASELDLLAAEHRAYRHGQETSLPWLHWGEIGGRAVILALITALLCVYVAHRQPRTARDSLRGTALVALLLAMLAAGKAMVTILGWNPHVVVLPVLMAATVLAIAYEQRFAFVVGAILAVLVVLQLRLGIEMFIILLSGVMIVAFRLREIRRRSRLIEVSVVAAVVVLAAVTAEGLSAAAGWKFILIDGLWATGFTLLVGFIVQGLLPVIERLFGVATSLTLLEWCDASKPLLKRLAMETPGTYNHSLQLGAICEAAADAISARGLLARVGAYYHDVGKINKPDYFTENQTGGSSRHAKLSPAMSLLIIIAHVKDGLELAREYGLPSVLYEFIATHHGTTLVQYFYAAATQMRKSAAQRPPDEVEFRYPGPKPSMKESAILMLADAAESSVHSMSEPTPGRIENQVHTIVNRRLMDGQLDECDLTLKEVHKIELSLIRSLCAMYHSRVSYPTPAGGRPSAAELLVLRHHVEKTSPTPPDESEGNPAMEEA